VIGEEPPKTSDPEVAAKRAIDEAVATLRSLAEGVQSRPPPRPAADTRPDEVSPDQRVAPSAELPARPPLQTRLRDGFHRLGLVLAVACLAIAGGMLLAASDPAEGRADLWRAVPLLVAAGAVYLLCRSMAWVALGFIGEPARGDAGRARAAEDGTAPLRARPGPRGFGGWLWFPAIAAAFAPIAILQGLYSLAANFHEVTNRSPEARAFLFALAVISIGFLIGWLYALVLMARRRRRFPRLYISLTLLSLALFAVSWVVTALYFEYFDWAEFLKTSAEELARLIWIPYLLRSRRVRNTFVN
jgi:hypothetical protein